MSDTGVQVDLTFTSRTMDTRGLGSICLIITDARAASSFVESVG